MLDPATPEELFARLDELGIVTRTVEHPPVFTVEESRRLCGDLPGGHCKCLFLRDKNRSLWLVVALEHRLIDLKELRRELGARKNLSFGSAELLGDVLGVTPGAVTPFALFNDRERRVTVVLDKGMLEVDPLNYHPLTNDRTTAISPADLVKFIQSCGQETVLLDFDERV